MPLFVEKPTIRTILADVRPESKSSFVDWQAKFNATIATFPGFVSLEFLSPSEEQKGWLVVQRFSDAEAAAAWYNSIPYRELEAELKTLLVSDGFKEYAHDEFNVKGNVTELFVTEVNPERESDFRNWTAKIHQVEAKFPGFRGVYVQSPAQSTGRHWITLLQFDTMKNLDQWIGSNERKDLLKESSSLISSLESHRVISPYAGWFASIAKVGEMPPVWKQTMIVLLVLFPIVMFELKYLSPLTAGYDISLATFIGNALSVALISFPMMPIAIWCLGWWLSSKSQRITIIGTFVMILLYLIEIAIFWKFL